jgi:hypothetical protein
MKIFARKQKTAIKTGSQAALHKLAVWIKQHEIHNCRTKLLFPRKMTSLKPFTLLICIDPNEQVIAQSKSFLHCEAYKDLGVCFNVVVHKNFMHFHAVCLTTSTEVGHLKQVQEVFERNKESAVILIHMIVPCIKLRCPSCGVI